MTSFSNLTMHGKANSSAYLKATTNLFDNQNHSNFSIFPNEIANEQDYYYLIPTYLNNCSPGYRYINKYQKFRF